MANINDAVRRFENGGSLLVGTDPVLNIVPGSLKFKPAMRERIEYTDRGVQQTPLLGDDMYGELSFSTRGKPAINGSVESAYSKFFAEAGTTTPDVFTLVIKIPTYRGAATYDNLSFANCFLTEPPQMTAGGEGKGLDTYEFTFKVPARPTVTVV